MNHKGIAIIVLSIVIVTVSCTVHAQDAAASTPATGKSNGLDPVNVAAVVIATAALGLSIYQGYVSRRHDRLSVKPLLDSEFFCGPDYKRFCLNLINHGLGPAIIWSFELLVDDKPNSRGGKELAAYLKFPQTADINWGYFTSGSIFATEETLELIGHQVGTYNNEAAKEFSTAVNRLKYRIGYTTLYGESYVKEVNGADCQGA